MNWWSRVSESCELLLQIIHAQEGGFGTSDLYYVGQKQRWQPGLPTNIKNWEETLWDWALHLWNLVCYFQMQCQNWVELCRGFGAQLCLTPCDPHGLVPLWLNRFLCAWNSPGKNTGVGCCFLLQGILLTQNLNLGLRHCRQILYYLSYQGRHFGR